MNENNYYPDYYQDPTTGEWLPSIPTLIAKVKAHRNRLLYDSDWTQLPDVALANKEAWATYRQALRDITEQLGYPTEINWPVQP